MWVLIYILKKYFEKKADGSKIYRNQKQEEMLNYKTETDNYENKNFDDFDYDLSDNTSNTNNNDKFKSNVKQVEVNKRNVSQLLKIRIADSVAKSPNGKQKCCKLRLFYVELCCCIILYQFLN
jgi:hypothetical protein